MISKIEMYAWDSMIGIAVEEGNRLSVELYDKSFSPLQFESSNVVTIVRPNGEIGLIGDSIPGAYGLDYLGRFFFDEFGKKPLTLDVLAFIGGHGLGAIEFKPPSDLGDLEENAVISLRELKTQTRKAYEGEHSFNTAKLIAISNSAIGGARAKAAVGFDPLSKKVYIGQKNAQSPEPFKKCIIKFNAKQGKAAHAYDSEIKLEYLYSRIAHNLGIKMSECWLVEDDEHFHFATERFDIDQHGNRLHMHSFAGLIGSDASSFSTSYDALFRVANRLAVSREDKEQIFKTMVFNLVFGNRDDHARNFSFLMDQSRSWSFAPAYDLTYASHSFGANKHQLKINRRFADSASRKEILLIAKILEISNPIEIFDLFITYKHEQLIKMISEYNIDSNVGDEIISSTSWVDKIAFKKNLFIKDVSHDNNRNAHAFRL